MIEEEYSEEMLEWGRWLFAQECRFMQSVPKPSDLPELVLPEIAFAGRSNVGKSSLINGLTGRLTLARTSNTPGRTQQLNFFCLAEKLILVDMPGYGYAAASKSLVAGWQKLIKIYLRGRSTLYRVYLLIDSRHGLKPNDFEIMKMLDETAVSYQIILTKADKISETAAQQVYAKTVEALGKHPAAHPKVILTSAAKGMGIAEVRAEIAQFAHIKV
jgi:GTP-binding protein